MTTKNPQIFSDLAIPPGEILEEELEAVGMTQKELAARLDRPPQVVNEIIRGKKAITPETALELEKVLGIHASFWINLESDYRMTVAKVKERNELAKMEEWLTEFPVGEMEKRSWIPLEKYKPEKLRRLLEFLGVASAPAYREAIGFRITPAAAAKVSQGALTVWLRKGELDARAISTAPYDEERFRQVLSEARGMTRQPPEKFQDPLLKLCASAGVVLLPIQELPRSGANGATRWLAEDRALIQLSLRYKSQDIFWFTFFHEAGHLLIHKSQKMIVDGIGGADDEIEREADEFARDFLIQKEVWERFVKEDYFTPGSITKLADELGISPGIVVGRLHKEAKLNYNQLAHLKGKYTWKQETDP